MAEDEDSEVEEGGQAAAPEVPAPRESGLMVMASDWVGAIRIAGIGPISDARHLPILSRSA